MISVLVRAEKDSKVFRCIGSIRNTSPGSKIVVSLTPNKSIERILTSRGIKYCVVPKKNVSITTNRGLELVETDKVLITDSDTIFAQNCIKLLDAALDNYDVVKPHLIFQRDASLLGVLVTNLRNYFNSKNQKMFTPGLAFRMSLKSKIGGYFFDNGVAKAEDSEFSKRLEENNIKRQVVRRAKLFHTPISVKHDLAGALLIGAKKPETKSFPEMLSKRVRIYYDILNSFGLLTLFYGLVWYAFFDLGKLSNYMGGIGKKMQNYFWKL
jgi:hypothetical protein